MITDDNSNKHNNDRKNIPIIGGSVIKTSKDGD